MDRKVIYFYPDYSSGNPYQKLMYQPVRELQCRVIAGTIRDALADESRAEKIIFHIHWINALFKGVTNPKDAWVVVNSFIHDISKFQAEGGIVMWTIHNHLPHENPFAEHDLRIRHFLCSQADRIHLHCGSHISELDFLSIDPSKVAVHRHGSYIGYYGDFDIKHRLARIDGGKLKAVFIGQLRKYKAIDRILSIAKELVDKGVEVTIAGNPDSMHLKTEIEAFAEKSKINTILRRLTEKEIHDLCLDSDMGIVSYEKILTSGTLKLYMSYGMIIIAPDLTSMEFKDRLGCFVTYEVNAPSFSFEYKMLSPEELKKRSTMSFMMAQELRWSSSLFDF